MTRPEVNKCQSCKGRLLRSVRIIPLAPYGGQFLVQPPTHLCKQSLFCTAEWLLPRHLASGYLFRYVSQPWHIFRLCLAFQMCFRVVAPPNGLTRIGRLNHLVCYFTFWIFGRFPIHAWSHSHRRPQVSMQSVFCISSAAATKMVDIFIPHHPFCGVEGQYVTGKLEVLFPST